MPRLTTFLMLTVMVLGLSAQDGPMIPLGLEDENPLATYISELDKLGRLYSGWGSKDSTGTSWFFASHALLLTQDYGRQNHLPFPGMASLIPGLWQDVKYLSPAYLIELAGGALSSSELMSLTRRCDLEKIQEEERFILHVAGLSHLRMLHGTIGDSLYHKVVEECVRQTSHAEEITEGLVQTIHTICGPELAQQFEIVISGRTWVDVELLSDDVNTDSIRFHAEYANGVVFPFETQFVMTSGDTMVVDSQTMARGVVLHKAQIASVEVDPRHVLSEYYRHNNRWPRFRGNVQIQPFFGLPDWTNYRVVVSPSSWSDWDGDKRYGLKIVSGFGIDLWPAYPSDYRHRTTLELNTHGPLDNEVAWGSRFTYGHPLSLKSRLFTNFSLHRFDDWHGASLGVTKYLGKQTFLVQGSRLIYQRVSLGVEIDAYDDPDIWAQKQNVKLVKTAYTGLSLTRYGDRVYVRLRGAQGTGPSGRFEIMKSQIDLSGVFFGWLVGGLHLVAGSQSLTTPEPYQFTHYYAWQDELSALPRFRGQNRIDSNTHGYTGLSASGGYWVSWLQLKLFGSSMMYAQEGIEFSEVKPRYAAGFGFEHKSIFTAGLYFPIWQSHPLEGEQEWQWRYQWRFVWNL